MMSQREKKLGVVERVRRGAIKALGGYTEQFLPIERPPEFHVQTRNVRKFGCSVEIPPAELTIYGDEIAIGYAHERLVHEIAKGLDKGKAIQITKKELYGTPKMLCAEIEVVVPETDWRGVV